ncbi:MAG: hypothetical protein ABI818_13945 [Acidobacteriota bacterium]
MEFSAYAAKETSALIERVVTDSSQAALQRVEALRAAIDGASKALEAALAEAPDTATQVADLVTRLTKAATTDGDARLKRLSSEARKITETLRADLEEQIKEKEELAATLAETQTEAGSVRADFEAAQQEAEQARQQLAEAIAAQQALDAARAEAIAASDEEATARAIAEAELLELRGQLEAAEAAAEANLLEARAQLEAAQAAAEAEVLRIGSQLEAVQNAAEAEVLEVRGQLEAAQSAADANVLQIREQLEAAQATAASVQEARSQLEAAQAAAEAEVRQVRGQLDAARSGAEAKLLEAGGLLDEARAAAEAKLLEMHEQLEGTRAEAARAVAAAEEQAHARATAEADLQALLNQLEATRADAARALAAGDQEAGARAAVEGELQGLRSQLEAARAESARAATLLDGAVSDKEKLAAALGAAKSAAAAADGKVSAASTRLKTTTARLQALEHEREESAMALADLEERVRVAESEGGSSAALPVMDNLLRGLEALSAAGTIDDVLTTLIEQLAGEFARVALFKVKGNRLEGAHQIGFALTNDIGKVMMPLAMDSVLTRAVTSGRTERVSGDDLLTASGLPFGGSPAWAVAAPIVVDGESLAVVYADDSGQARPDRLAGAEDLSVKFADAMRQHAVALLTRLTRELKSQAELRAYAGSLFDEVEHMYRADEAAGKTGDELVSRLHANLDYARSIFANRTAYESPVAAGLLEAELTGMLDLHRESGFGRDLATVSSWDADGKASAAPRAATAS